LNLKFSSESDVIIANMFDKSTNYAGCFCDIPISALINESKTPKPIIPNATVVRLLLPN